MGRITCAHCGRSVTKNPRIKGIQRYCGLKACQQFRKNQWERNSLNHLSGYRAKRKACKEKWSKAQPGYIYQRSYRESHGEYVLKNRLQQRDRNRQKESKSDLSTKIVKTDALTSISLISGGLYALIPCKSSDFEKIVKTDALIVQLKEIQRNTGFVAPNSG
jgi:hypothetical protein